MSANRKSSSDVLLEEIDSVSGEKCGWSCDHHDYIVNKQLFSAVCERAGGHAGATLMVDVHAYIVAENKSRYPVVFTEHCCMAEEGR